jgi:NhaP-type Na+/H+ or K+/H+ antiporter
MKYNSSAISMTMEMLKKMQRQYSFFYLFLIYSVGVIEGLLVVRLLARLLAGRETNTLLALLYGLTDPLVAGLIWLDAGQPRFGATLELSTLLLAICVPIVGYGVWWLWRGQREAVRR